MSARTRSTAAAAPSQPSAPICYATPCRCSKTRARAYFGYLRFQRTLTTGDQPFQTQADMVQQYAARYPALTIGHSVEVTGTPEHSNWFGGEQHLINHATAKPADFVAYATEKRISRTPERFGHGLRAVSRV